MLDEIVSPAADQPESWAVGQPPFCFEFCELHTGRKHKDLFIDLFKPLRTFAQLPNADFIPFLASFHFLTDLEIIMHQQSLSQSFGL
eukprot:1136537-Pelagomonas_calceolata.AAC.9